MAMKIAVAASSSAIAVLNTRSARGSLRRARSSSPATAHTAMHGRLMSALASASDSAALQPPLRGRKRIATLTTIIQTLGLTH